MNDLATTRIDDVLVHPRENDLVLATHGLGIQIMDDITPLQQLTPSTSISLGSARMPTLVAQLGSSFA